MAELGPLVDKLSIVLPNFFSIILKLFSFHHQKIIRKASGLATIAAEKVIFVYNLNKQNNNKPKD